MRPVLALWTIACVLGLPSGEQHATVTASAYNSLPSQTDGNPNEGAWGDEIKPGMKVIAVSPDLLESGLDRGTEVQISGLEGTWTVLDRTASRHRNRIDIYMGIDVDAAIAWGLKEVTISWSPATP
jgi:3D (Asp-Asp-Asp) domain-containing protein